MPVWLAYGEQADQSGADWVLVLAGAFILAVAAILAAIPIVLAGRRATASRRELVLAAALLWGIVAAGTALSSATARFKWAHQRDILIQSGYYDPSQKDAPVPPLGWWGVVAAAYPALLVLSLARKRGGTPPPASGEESQSTG